MTWNEATGDLFKFEDWNKSLEPVDCIGHGVNCKGMMGSGIAVPFRKSYPEMYTHYKSMCDQDFLLPGMVLPWKADGLWIFNIASQYQPGPSAKLEYLEMGLLYCLFTMRNFGLKHLALPRIGAGIGGLEWSDVKWTVDDIFEDTDEHVTLVSLEGA
jgi:O-acetyl-ADP-ribose deacetylase (regulator of RNase III)